MTLLVGQQERHPACKKWWVAGVVICLRGADFHDGPADELPSTVSCFSKIQNPDLFYFSDTGSSGYSQTNAIKWVLLLFF